MQEDALNMATMTKYPSNLDDGLMARLEREFTTEEQGLFLQSFSAYLNHDPSDFVIDLDDVWEWMGFADKGKAKRPLEKHFVEGKDFMSASSVGEANTSLGGQTASAPLVCKTNTGRGGQNRQRIMMSVRTFKKLCMKAATAKAPIVREYYLTMEEVLMTHLKEREANSVRQLMEERAASVLAVERITADSELLIAQNKHNALVAANPKRGVVYIGTLVWNGVVYHKIGGSDDIQERAGALPREFNKTFHFLWVKAYPNWRKIEGDVLELEPVKAMQIGIIKSGGQVSRETLKLTDEFSVDTLITHIKHVAARLASIAPSAEERAETIAILQAHIMQDSLQIRSRELDMAEAAAKRSAEATAAMSSSLAQATVALCGDTRNVILGTTVQALANQLPAVLTVPQHTPAPTPVQPQPAPEVVTYYKPRANGRGDGVQKYEIIQTASEEDTFVLMEPQFSGPTDAARDLNTHTDMHATASGIANACKTSAEYCGFRWLMTTAADLHTPQILEPTAYVKRERSAMVAMINLKKTQVVEVFKNQRLASVDREVTPAALSRAMKCGTKSSGHYWQRWIDVSEELRSVYLQTHNLPGNMQHVHSKAIELIDPRDGSTYMTFDSTQDAVDRMQVSRKSIADTISNGLPMKGFVWRWASV